MQSELTGERRVSLSTEIASRRGVQFAQAAVAVSAVFFFFVVPFGTRPLAGVPAFISAYEAALVICDLITAVLLFNQFNVLRSRSLFVLANGYLFTAFIIFSHTLTFPGVYSATGLLGAGHQSSVWLYVFWHAGFPIFVIAYALLGDGERKATATIGGNSLWRDGFSATIPVGVAAVLAVVCGLTLVATVGSEFLPVLLQNNRATTALTVVGASFWILSLLALFILWRRRPYTVLDLWLMVVMCAWLLEVALFVVLDTSRFDLGWYAARVYALLAASSLLIVLLTEAGSHNARLVQMSAKLSAANKSLEQLSLHDGLTDLANRRFFDAYLAEQIAVARRHKRTLALVLCDVDAFKAFNDHYGHQAGDDCLRQIAAAIQSCCRRPGDKAARYGGEEFALILPDTGLIGAAKIAEAARDAVAQLKIPHAYSPAGSFISISGGISALLQKIDISAQQLIAAADQTMYQAKEQGRNRMISVQAEGASAA
jgi:diguanylate cyclase (GGDEF)-like protein